MVQGSHSVGDVVITLSGMVAMSCNGEVWTTESAVIISRTRISWR